MGAQGRIQVVQKADVDAPEVADGSKVTPSKTGDSQGNPESTTPQPVASKHGSSQDDGSGAQSQSSPIKPPSKQPKKVRFDEISEERELLDNMKKWKSNNPSSVKAPGGVQGTPSSTQKQAAGGEKLQDIHDFLKPEEASPPEPVKSGVKPKKKKNRNRERSVPLQGHNIITHWPKDPRCEICNRCKLQRAHTGRITDEEATGRPAYSKFLDSVVADHKVLANEAHSHQESNQGDRVVLVVKDRATEWLQAYPAKTKSTEEVERAMTQFCGSTDFPKHLYTDNAPEFKKVGVPTFWTSSKTTEARRRPTQPASLVSFNPL